MSVDTLGINATELCILKPDDMRRVVADIAAFGFEHVRVEIPWRLVEQAKGKPSWGQVFYPDFGYVVAGVEATRDACRAAGLTMLPVLGVHAPAWAWGPADVKAFATRAAQVLGAPAYEVWNEMNLASFVPGGDAKTYVPWLKAAHDGIDSVQPTAQVIMGGLAAAVDASGFNWAWWLGPFGPWRNTSPETFLTAAIANGARGSFDAVAYHPYNINQGFVAQPPTADQQMIAKLPGVARIARTPVLETEWGFDYTKTTPAQAAKWFNAQLPLMTDRSYFYCWRDFNAYKFGLVDANNQPRQPIYDTVKAALR